jgi:lipooligosaccharide transport system permease protein
VIYRAALAWQSRAVLMRHLRVYLRNWYTGFLPPAAEPIVMLVAFGFGLGAHVGGMGIDGRYDYASYIAPGMIAYTAFLTAFFQCLFGAFIRMHYQRTWDGQLTSQIELPHVIWGEILWGASLATMYVTILIGVIAAGTLGGWLTVDIRLLPLVVPVVFCFAIAFACLSLTFTALLPSIDHMNLPVFLLALPMGFASNTYFPVPMDHPLVALLMNANPLYHLSEGNRSLLLTGSWDGVRFHYLMGVGECLVLVLVLLPIIQRSLRRRVVGEG